MAQIDEMQNELKQRHQQELDAFKIDGESGQQEVILNSLVDSMALQNEADDEESETAPGPKIKYEVRQVSSKTQKKRDKKAAKEKFLQINPEDSASHLNDSKKDEAEKLSEILQKRCLKIHEVPPDGDCMYSAISHQLRTLNGIKNSVQDLRHMTSEHILHNSDHFVPFLINEETGDMMSDSDLREYCDKIGNSSIWGGQLELRALSEVLKRPIEVVQANGPQVIVGDHFPSSDVLLISYHRHSYSLGEHYNSLIPADSPL